MKEYQSVYRGVPFVWVEYEKDPKRTAAEQYEKRRAIDEQRGSEPDNWMLEPDNRVFKHIGYDLNTAKMRMMMEFAENFNKSKFNDGMHLSGRDLIYNFFSLPSKDQRAGLGDELLNFIIGPCAERYKVNNDLKIFTNLTAFPLLYTLVEVLSMGLLPASARKDFYPKFLDLGDTFAPQVANVEEGPLGGLIVNPDPLWEARIQVYSLLADVCAPIFDEVGAGEIAEITRKIIAENPAQADKAREDQKLVGWFMGQVMKQLKTKTDPNAVRAVILEELTK